MTSVHTTLSAQYLPALEAELHELLTPPSPKYVHQYSMVQYHMGWLDADLTPRKGKAGKRVRPILLLLSCEAAGGKREMAMPAAVAVEVLHNFSLLHDDIEDASDTRRGVPSVWSKWGAPLAINAGDGLYALAHVSLTNLVAAGVPACRALNAMRIFSETCLDLTHGQHLDMLFEHRLDVGVDEYELMIRGKTAALVAASAQLGALLAGVDEPVIDAYREFGFHVGLAFQIRDDVLGIWGDAAATGKSVSTDIETRKKTLPVVFGLERSQILREWYASGPPKPDRARHIAQILEELGARQMAEEAAAEHHRLSLAALDRSGAAGQAGEALYELASSLLTRAS
jgi:geranylgeranyl diphosphate synthase type I